MEQLIEKARELGKKIADHERTKALKKSQETALEDPDANKLLEEYQEQAQKMQALQEQAFNSPWQRSIYCGWPVFP